MCEPVDVAELRVLRARYDVTQDEVGRRYGLSRGMWSKVERSNLPLHESFLEAFELVCQQVAAEKAAAREQAVA